MGGKWINTKATPPYKALVERNRVLEEQLIHLERVSSDEMHKTLVAELNVETLELMVMELKEGLTLVQNLV